MLSTVSSIHSFLPTLLWMSLLLLGIWGMARAILKKELKGVFLTAAMVAQIAMIVQAVLGVVLWIAGAWPLQGFLHIALGMIASIFLFGVNAFVRGDTSNRAQWIFSVGVLLFLGVALLAVITG